MMAVVNKMTTIYLTAEKDQTTAGSVLLYECELQIFENKVTRNIYSDLKGPLRTLLNEELSDLYSGS
jgi:hypothetical protein